MKSRKAFEAKFANPVMGDVHISAKAVEDANSSVPEFAKSITQVMSERNLHITTINGAMDKLLDGKMSPEEYVDIVSEENNKLARS
jgi:hypothetical protein